MESYYPYLKAQEQSTLFFLGNGFDLYHELNTRYRDFRKWLIRHGYNDFVLDMEKMFPSLCKGEPMLWTDFEKALESAEPNKIHNDFFQGTDDGWYNEEIQKRVYERIKIQLDKIPSLLREWIKSIPIGNVPQSLRLNISPRSLYLSFNYTLLLEHYYFIPDDKILHVHGSLANNDPLITGHGIYYSEDITNDHINVEKSSMYISKKLNQLRKPVDVILNQHRDFFDSLSGIRNVIIFGHSLSMIDRRYFIDVICHVQDYTQWYFVVQDEINKKSIMRLVYEINKSIKNQYDGYRFSNKIKIENCSFIQIKNINKPE